MRCSDVKSFWEKKYFLSFFSKSTRWRRSTSFVVVAAVVAEKKFLINDDLQTQQENPRHLSHLWQQLQEVEEEKQKDNSDQQNKIFFLFIHSVTVQTNRIAVLLPYIWKFCFQVCLHFYYKNTKGQREWIKSLKVF